MTAPSANNYSLDDTISKSLWAGERVRGCHCSTLFESRVGSLPSHATHTLCGHVPPASHILPLSKLSRLGKA